ncbi:MAG: type II toxin-antitoxin system RelE/ParE family toxin [Microbacteriaceae bacterium]
MTSRVVIRPVAERDIDHALGWYLENAPEHAERFIDDLRTTIYRIRESSRLFRTVHGDVRRVALQKFPYLVWLIYFDESDIVHILAVSHQRQDPESIRQRLL